MNFIRNQRLNFAKRHLENKLAKILDVTQGHVNAKVPAGHKFYGILYKKAGMAIVEYQNKEIKLGFPASDYNEIVVGVPALEELEKMANGKAEKGMIIPAIIGLLIIWWGGTALIAFTHNFYCWLVK